MGEGDPGVRPPEEPPWQDAGASGGPEATQAWPLAALAPEPDVEGPDEDVRPAPRASRFRRPFDHRGGAELGGPGGDQPTAWPATTAERADTIAAGPGAPVEDVEASPVADRAARAETSTVADRAPRVGEAPEPAVRTEPVGRLEASTEDEAAPWSEPALAEEPIAAPDPGPEDDVDIGEPPDPALDHLDRAYEELRATVVGVLDAAHREAEELRDSAAAEANGLVAAATAEAAATEKAATAQADAIVRAAAAEAAERAEAVELEAERMRVEAEEYARDMRLAVDAYATRQRRDADEEARTTVAKAEARARATREAAEERVREAEEAARRRQEEIQDESRILEERRRRVLEGLRDIASQLEEVPIDPTAPQGGRPLRAVDRRR